MQKQPTVVVCIIWQMHEKHILADVLGAKLTAIAARHPSKGQIYNIQYIIYNIQYNIQYNISLYISI